MVIRNLGIVRDFSLQISLFCFNLVRRLLKTFVMNLEETLVAMFIALEENDLALYARLRPHAIAMLAAKEYDNEVVH